MEPDPSASDARSAASAAADALADVEWADVAEADLVATMTELERAQRLLDHAKLEIARRLEATDAAAADGWATAKDFLTAVAGGHKGAGNGTVRLARRLEDLPATRAAMAAGHLSRAQAAAIVRNVGHLPRVPELRDAAEARLLEAARDLDATDLDRIFPTIVDELDPDGTLLGTDLSLPRQERAAHRQRYLALTPDSYGGVRIRGYGTAEDAEFIKATLIPLTAPVTSEPGACGADPRVPGETRDREAERENRRRCPDPDCRHDGRDPREFGVRLWDALVEACHRLQTTDLLPHTHRAPPRLTVTVDHDVLRARAACEASDRSAEHGRGMLLSGGDISAAAVRRLACDAEIIPAVLGTDSQILDLGRSHRLVTPALWQALVLRDRHCAFPGCTRLPDACDAHHIVHWADGGPTSLDNMLLTCRGHHVLLHNSPWTVTIDPESHKPVWIPPPRIDDTGRYSYVRARVA